MKLSVIVPIYNSEKYLHRCLESLDKISYKDMEILCIDDGSIDSSADICMNYVLKDKRFKIIRQRNAGLPAARNQGLKAAQGEYISFVDSDDWIEAEMLPTFIQKMDEDLSIDLCISGAVRNYPDGSEYEMFETELERMFTGAEALEEMVSNRLFFWYMWGKLYRRRIFDGFHADENVTTSEDLDSNWKLFAKKGIKNAWYSSRYKYHYFMNPESMTEGRNILERRQSDLSVYTKVLGEKGCIQLDYVIYQMKMYSLHAIYDIIRELCFYDTEKECVDQYILKGRDLIASLGKVKDRDIKFVDRMQELTGNVRYTKNYFFEIFQSIKQIIVSTKGIPEIYIYGTGSAAKYVSAMLREIRDYKGFVISDNMPNIQWFRGKPVFHISQISDKCTLLLAMNKVNQKSVIHSLKGRDRIIFLPIPDDF